MNDDTGSDPCPMWARRINEGIGTTEDYQTALSIDNPDAWAGSSGKLVKKAINKAKKWSEPVPAPNNTTASNVGTEIIVEGGGPIIGGNYKNDYPNYPPVDGVAEYHGARDIVAAIGTPIYAVFPGTVVTSDSHPSYGTNVVIDSGIRGEKYQSIYAHMAISTVDVGWDVSVGDIIGYVELTGNTDGAHVHWETRNYNNKKYTYRSNNIDPVGLFNYYYKR